MKLPSKYISLLVILSLTGIFAYQAYWLTGLYHTMHSDLERNIAETMRMSDYNEMMIRVKRLQQNSEKHGTVDVSAGFIPEEKPSVPNKAVTVVRVADEDSLPQTVQTDTVFQEEPHAALRTSDGMDFILENRHNMDELAIYLQKGLHSGLDSFSNPNVQVFDSLLTLHLQRAGITLSHRLEYLYLGEQFTDTLAVTGTPNYRPSPNARTYEYDFDVHAHHRYRLTLEPIDRLVLRQMSGILATSFIILLILAFSFWFLIRTLLRQKTLEEMKSDFTNNITHELKTPISVAYAANDALLNFSQAKEKAQRDKYLRICQEQLQHLSGLVEQILSMSMERRKSFRFCLEELSLQEITEQLAEQHRLKADKPVRISLDIEPKDLSIFADRTHFSNILSNLIDNAIKYSPEEADIEIRCRKDTAKGAKEEQTEISVRDHGIGIAPDRQRHIFDKFYRVPTGNLHDVKGYGLGLFYAKTMTEKHGGTLSVRSEVGKGSTFSIKLPASPP